MRKSRPLEYQTPDPTTMLPPWKKVGCLLLVALLAPVAIFLGIVLLIRTGVLKP